MLRRVGAVLDAVIYPRPILQNAEEKHGGSKSGDDEKDGFKHGTISLSDV